MYQQTMTPTWLEAHASYIDSHGTFTAEQLTFNAGAVDNPALLTVPIIPAGVMTDSTPMTLEIPVGEDLSIGNLVDSDTRYGVSDGTNFIGFEAPDKLNYGTKAPCYGVEGKSATTLSSIQTKLMQSLQNRVTLSIQVSLSSLSSWMNAGARATLRMTEAS